MIAESRIFVINVEEPVVLTCSSVSVPFVVHLNVRAIVYVFDVRNPVVMERTVSVPSVRTPTATDYVDALSAEVLCVISLVNALNVITLIATVHALASNVVILNSILN